MMPIIIGAAAVAAIAGVWVWLVWRDDAEILADVLADLDEREGRP